MESRGIFAINGQVASSPWTIPANDRGFLYGEAVFESMSAFGDLVFDLDKHLERLEFSASAMEIELPLPASRIKAITQAHVAAAGLPRAFVRLYLTAGPDSAPATWYLIISPPDNDWIASVQQLQKEGASLQPASLGFTIRDPQPKWASYGRSVAPLRRAREQGFSDILWINSEREVVEASTANIFFIGRQGDQLDLITPPSRSGALEGIMRAWVMARLREARIRCDVATVFSEELPRFDEAFVTSSLKGIVPVSRIGNHRLGTCRPKSVFQDLQRLFRAGLTREIGANVDWVSGKK
jgi:branched-chain amino acid aminotransferase